MASILRFDQWQSTTGANYNPVVQYVDYKLPAAGESYVTIADGVEYQTLSLSITPKFSTSKLVVSATSQMRIINAPGANSRLKRDGNNLGGQSNGSVHFFYKGDAVNHHVQLPATLSVIAGSTATTTFTYHIVPFGGTGEFVAGLYGEHYIQIWEIAQ